MLNTIWDEFAPFFFLTSIFFTVFYFTLYPLARKVFWHLSGVKMPGTFRMVYLVFSRLWLWLVWLPLKERAAAAAKSAGDMKVWLLEFAQKWKGGRK